MTAPRIALIVVGVLMLLPGLCGTAVLGMLGGDAFSRWFDGRGQDPYAILAVYIAGMSFQIGCVGLVLLLRQFPLRWLLVVTRVAGALGLAMGLFLAYSYLADTFFGTRQAPIEGMDIVMMVVIFGGLLFGSIPALLARLPGTAPAERPA